MLAWIAEREQAHRALGSVNQIRVFVGMVEVKTTKL